LKDETRPLISVEPIGMIIGALQTVEVSAEHLDETTVSNYEMLRTICERKDLFEMALHE